MGLISDLFEECDIDLDDYNFGRICCGCCCCASFITIIIVISISFASIGSLDLALNYDMVSCTIENTVYATAGLHFIGPGHKFIKYPKTVQLVEFVASHGPECPTCYDYDILTARTSDGLPVSLSISFQYRYDPSKIWELYHTFKQEERQVYEDTTYAVVQTAATNFTAYQFFNDKNDIAIAMHTVLSEKFYDELFAIIDAFQITRVELPTEFQDSLLASIEAKQNITTAQSFKDNMEVTFRTQLLEANQTRYQTIALAHGAAAQRREEAEAKAQVTRQRVQAEMYAYGNISTTVGIDDVTPYIWWEAQSKDRDRVEYLVGLDPDFLAHL